MSVPMLIEQLNNHAEDKTLYINIKKNNLSIYKPEDWENSKFPIPTVMRLDFNGKIYECIEGSVIIGNFGMVRKFKKIIIIVNILFFMVGIFNFYGKDDFIVDIFVLGIAQLIFNWILEKIYIFLAHLLFKKQEKAVIKFLETFGHRR